MSLTVERSSYKWVDGHPVLELQIDGRMAAIEVDHKRSILMAGFVIVGFPFEDLWPPVRLSPTQDHSTMTLRGATDDPVVMELVLDFLNACDQGTFVEGDVAIPTLPAAE